jgi:D-beta-D-heptose 7-phosphate kinase / D-beta-D-heptose 1-phosphate adenosyltransferase
MSSSSRQRTAVELVRLVQPAYYAKGGDYTEQDLPESEAVVEQGGFVVILPLEAEQSTTRLVERDQIFGALKRAAPATSGTLPLPHSIV